ncbi:MAG: SAP domain-containing protein [Proteobacteria bacterium]|nr:SAP domain-containing protein [Pseudomonadota bacterium]
MPEKFPCINPHDLKTLKEGLNFLHVEELKNLCRQLLLPIEGKKGILVLRILHFVETGKVMNNPKLPLVSCAEKGKDCPLTPNSFILKGSYKNDLKTRVFFKKLIGDDFHFTAFGVDWIHNRWMEGNPPTYQEFADMWRAETKRRQEEGSIPKEEWAYINFTQRFIKKNPGTQRQGLIEAWEKERLKQKENVTKIMENFK